VAASVNQKAGNAYSEILNQGWKGTYGKLKAINWTKFLMNQKILYTEAKDRAHFGDIGREDLKGGRIKKKRP